MALTFTVGGRVAPPVRRGRAPVDLSEYHAVVRAVIDAAPDALELVGATPRDIARLARAAREGGAVLRARKMPGGYIVWYDPSAQPRETAAERVARLAREWGVSQAEARARLRQEREAQAAAPAARNARR